MASWNSSATLSLGSDRELRASRPFHEYCNIKGYGLGYARVLTVGQTLEAQLEQLKTAGCAIIYREKVSGAKADCKDLGRLLKSRVSGDAVVVIRIERLAGSTFESFAIVKRIVGVGGQFRSFAEPWADTRWRVQSSTAVVTVVRR